MFSELSHHRVSDISSSSAILYVDNSVISKLQELEKLASRKLRINAKETMQIAEKLYTRGFISYPRTETNGFPQDFDLRGLIQMQTVDPNWGGK
jgi:DNA topoisomerase IA